MSDKHYTPNIREIHIGLVYETQADDGIWRWSNVFEDIQLVARLIKDNRCRVKFLDREDIESLGWKYVPDDSQGDGNFRWFDEFTFGDFVFSFWGKLEDPNWQKESLRGLIMSLNRKETYFRGYIKNKSELKRIMNQLNINHGS